MKTLTATNASKPSIVGGLAFRKTEIEVKFLLSNFIGEILTSNKYALPNYKVLTDTELDTIMILMRKCRQRFKKI
jgi:hypothetical protein